MFKKLVPFIAPRLIAGPVLAADPAPATDRPGQVQLAQVVIVEAPQQEQAYEVDVQQLDCSCQVRQTVD